MGWHRCVGGAVGLGRPLCLGKLGYLLQGRYDLI